MSPWARIDDGFHAHPKVQAISLAASGLLVRAISYCAHYLTDGRIDPPFIRATAHGHVGRKALRELVDGGLLEPLEGGSYRVHDYLDFNPSRADVEAERDKQRRKKSNQRSRARQSSLPWDGAPLSPGDSPSGESGLGGASTSTEQTEPLDARPRTLGQEFDDLLGQVAAILKTCPRFATLVELQAAGIESAVAANLGKDALKAAHHAVVKGSDHRFNMESPARVLWMAFDEQKAPTAPLAGRSKAEREADDLAALQRLAAAEGHA
jgi:hypothetical protein